MSEYVHDMQLEALQQRSVDRLLMAEVFDGSAFAELHAYICGKTTTFRANPVLPKQLLACIVAAANVIETRVEWLPEVQASAHLADEFRRLLYLLIGSEAHDERRPGVPRIL